MIGTMETVQRSYSVKELAEMAGISPRTLHYYDQIGLLVAERQEENQYRIYRHTHLLKLQQILFFRELDFSLEQIREILSPAEFDMRSALLTHRAHLQKRRVRIDQLIATIDKTMQFIEGERNMSDQELYTGFSEEKQKEYEKEVREQYGDEPLETSMRNWNSLSKQQQEAKIAQGHELRREIADAMPLGYADPQVMVLIRQHFTDLQFFYEVNLERYEALGHMYNDDPRFRATYETVAPGLAAFMEKAIAHFVKLEKQK
jgi:DNA-binding transcriptional MerR regulator